MKVPIRMISVATSFLWVLLIIFSVSAIYSMKDIRLDVGKPQTTITTDNELLLNFPIGIVNNGYYDLDDFNISTEMRDVQKSMMAQGFTFIPVIRRGETFNTTHQMGINLTDMLQNHQRPHTQRHRTASQCDGWDESCRADFTPSLFESDNALGGTVIQPHVCNTSFHNANQPQLCKPV